MRAEATVVNDPVHGETLVVTYHVRRRQLERDGGNIERIIRFMNRDVMRRVLAWRRTWS